MTKTGKSHAKSLKIRHPFSCYQLCESTGPMAPMSSFPWVTIRVILRVSAEADSQSKDSVPWWMLEIMECLIFFVCFILSTLTIADLLLPYWQENKSRDILYQVNWMFIKLWRKRKPSFQWLHSLPSFFENFSLVPCCSFIFSSTLCIVKIWR